jgi:hypothetical protein
MLNDRVRRGDEDALVTVFPPDEIRRPTMVTVDLHDHTRAVLVSHVAAPDHQLIAHISAHCNRLLSGSFTIIMRRRQRREPGPKVHDPATVDAPHRPVWLIAGVAAPGSPRRGSLVCLV